MDHAAVQDWLDRYIQAWSANQPEPISALFSEDAVYRYRPYGDDEGALVGRQAIVDGWLEQPDDPGSWDARYEVFAVDGDRAVATGFSRYHPRGGTPERTYHNVFLLRFDGDGRCVEFTELYMLEEAG
jgi:ketosteroid isomerase-like protein